MPGTSALIAFLILLAGCGSSRGFNRGELSNALAPEAIVSEEEIGRVLALEPQLPRPFKLGVYFKKPTTRRWSAGWNWLPGDQQLFLGVGESFRGPGLVSEVAFVSRATTVDEEIKSIRLAAARHGVDAVLIVSGVSDIDRYNNPLGPSYALLLTAFFVPGTVIDSLFVAHAGLWDVRNGYLYASVETDGTASQTRPAFFAREEPVIVRAKAEALPALAEAIGQHIHNLDR